MKRPVLLQHFCRPLYYQRLKPVFQIKLVAVNNMQIRCNPVPASHSDFLSIFMKSPSRQHALRL